MEKEIVKTGTTTLALLCKDGVVLGADRRATAGYMIAHKKFTKIIPINEDMALTVAGNVSDAQLLVKIIKAQLRLDLIRRNKKPSVKEATNLAASLVYGNIRKFSTIPGIVGFLLAGRDEFGYHVYTIGPDGSVFENDDYACDGSGSEFAIGLLESGYSKDINVDEGVKLTVKALNSALQRDIASGSGYDVFVINKDGVKRVIDKELKLTL